MPIDVDFQNGVARRVGASPLTAQEVQEIRAGNAAERERNYDALLKRCLQDDWDRRQGTIAASSAPDVSLAAVERSQELDRLRPSIDSRLGELRATLINIVRLSGAKRPVMERSLRTTLSDWFDKNTTPDLRDAVKARYLEGEVGQICDAVFGSQEKTPTTKQGIDPTAPVIVKV